MKSRPAFKSQRCYRVGLFMTAIIRLQPFTIQIKLPALREDWNNSPIPPSIDREVVGRRTVNISANDGPLYDKFMRPMMKGLIELSEKSSQHFSLSRALTWKAPPLNFSARKNRPSNVQQLFLGSFNRIPKSFGVEKLRAPTKSAQVFFSNKSQKKE